MTLTVLQIAKHNEGLFYAKTLKIREEHIKDTFDDSREETPTPAEYEVFGDRLTKLVADWGNFTFVNYILDTPKDFSFSDYLPGKIESE